MNINSFDIELEKTLIGTWKCFYHNLKGEQVQGEQERITYSVDNTSKIILLESNNMINDVVVDLIVGQGINCTWNVKEGRLYERMIGASESPLNIFFNAGSFLAYTTGVVDRLIDNISYEPGLKIEKVTNDELKLLKLSESRPPKLKKMLYRFK